MSALQLGRPISPPHDASPSASPTTAPDDLVAQAAALIERLGPDHIDVILIHAAGYEHPDKSVGREIDALRSARRVPRPGSLRARGLAV